MTCCCVHLEKLKTIEKRNISIRMACGGELRQLRPRVVPLGTSRNSGLSIRRSEVHTAGAMKCTTSWVVTPCILVEVHRHRH
jgi:hypothetical protein